MFEKIFYTSVLVSDQDNALDFYTNVLGLEKRVENPTPDGPRFLTVGVEGDEFQPVLWPGRPGQAEPRRDAVRRRSRSTSTISRRRSRS
jgi:catechol 2,3-dioxygenase-like lactoylglutathione lyase family enzyme